MLQKLIKVQKDVLQTLWPEITGYLSQQRHHKLSSLSGHWVNEASHSRKTTTLLHSMSHLLENIKNLKENSPVLGPCPGQSGTHETKLSPGDDEDNGGEEQDTGKTGQQVEEHLGIKFMYFILW